jgi:hypothetical protein
MKPGGHTPGERSNGRARAGTETDPAAGAVNPMNRGPFGIHSLGKPVSNLKRDFVRSR